MTSCKSWTPRTTIYIYPECLSCIYRASYPHCPENDKNFRDYDSSTSNVKEDEKQ